MDLTFGIPDLDFLRLAICIPVSDNVCTYEFEIPQRTLVAVFGPESQGVQASYATCEAHREEIEAAIQRIYERTADKKDGDSFLVQQDDFNH